MHASLGRRWFFWTVLLLMLCCGASALGVDRGATQGSNLVIRHTRFAGDLVGALTFAAQTFRAPIVAEIAQPYPTNLHLPAGMHDGQMYMALIVEQCPDYGFESRRGVLWFYNKRLITASGNFLNLNFAKFKMPSDLGELKLGFPAYVQVAEGKGGGLLSGFKTPAETSVKLASETIENVGAREVLFRVAQQSGNVFSLFIFPDDNPTSSSEEDAAFANWTLLTIDSLASHPLHFRSLPAKPRRSSKTAKSNTTSP